MSRWNMLKGGIVSTFGQGFNLYRQRYQAEWSVTPSSITFRTATRMRNGLINDANTVGLGEHNCFKLPDIYPNLFVEYHWKYGGGCTDPPTETHHANVASDTTLVAAMLWSTLTSLDGLGNPGYNTSLNALDFFLRYSCRGSYVKTTPTLKAGYLLAATSAVNPFILISTLVIRLSLLNAATYPRISASYLYQPALIQRTWR